MPTEEKKPLSNAERARKYRERKAKERQEAADAAAEAEQAERDARDAKARSTPIPSQLQATNDALGAMKWLKDSDGALVNMARRYSRQIDDVLREDPSATGKAASLGQLLTRILHELGGTPTVRLQHELRSLRIQAGLQPEVPDAKPDAKRKPAVPGEATVTSITRPPKRSRPA